jgi:hypothetical protein
MTMTVCSRAAPRRAAPRHTTPHRVHRYAANCLAACRSLTRPPARLSSADDDDDDDDDDE